VPSSARYEEKAMVLGVPVLKVAAPAPPPHATRPTRRARVGKAIRRVMRGSRDLLRSGMNMSTALLTTGLLWRSIGQQRETKQDSY
jgi:hypothetical protein